MKKEPLKGISEVVLFAVIIVIVLIAVNFLFTSCSLSKKTFGSSTDSTLLSKSNSGQVKIDSSGSKTDRTKETVYYPQPIYIQGKDGETKVVFVPEKVRETEKIDQKSFNIDSAWNNKIDSLISRFSEKKTESKTKVLNLWQIIGIAAGCSLVFFVLGKVKIGIR